MNAVTFLDKLVVLLLGGLLVCLGMLFYNLHELEKIEEHLENRAANKASRVDKKLEEMILEMELTSGERARTRAVKSGIEESP